MFIKPAEKKDLTPELFAIYNKGAKLFADGKSYDGPSSLDCITPEQKAYISGYFNAEQDDLASKHDVQYSH